MPWVSAFAVLFNIWNIHPKMTVDEESGPLLLLLLQPLPLLQMLRLPPISPPPLLLLQRHLRRHTNILVVNNRYCRVWVSIDVTFMLERERERPGICKALYIMLWVGEESYDAILPKCDIMFSTWLKFWTGLYIYFTGNLWSLCYLKQFNWINYLIATSDKLEK